MGFFKKDKDMIMRGGYTVIEPFASFVDNDPVMMTLYADHIKFSMLKSKIATLEYSKITDVFYGLQSTIVEKDKSPIGRAVVGGLLFGGAGAIVGAMTANGKKKLNRMMLIISYTGQDGEDKFITLHDYASVGKKLPNKLKELCNISDPEPEQAHDVIL